MWTYPVSASDEIIEPVTLEAAKLQCRVDFDDDNALIAGLVSAGRDHVENYCGVKFAQRDLSASCETFRAMQDLPFSPVQKIVSIIYVDMAGESRTLSPDIYRLQSDPYDASIKLRPGKSWPAIQAGSTVDLIAQVGFEKVPDAVRHAILLFISDAYEKPEPSSSVQFSSFDALLCNHRRYW